MEVRGFRHRKLVVAAMCAAMFFIFGGVAQAESKPDMVDFVIVLDCTGTMAGSDPEYLSIAAVQMFVDILPIENARIGIMGFGPDWEGEMYVFHSDDSYSNASRVSLPYPIQNAGRDSERKKIKSLVKEMGTQRNGADTHTVLGTSLLAAMDALESSGAADNAACVILMSDGRITWDDADGGNYTKVRRAIDSAVVHEWPVYCIELNYDDKNGLNKGWQGVFAREWLEKIGTDTNGDRIEITSEKRENNGLDGIVQTFGTIFSRYMDVIPETGTIEIVNGQASKKFTIPEMVAETNIIVASPELLKVDAVSVTNPREKERTYTESASEDNCRVTIDKGKYVMIKLIQPMAGDWVITAYGQDGAKIYLQSISSQEMNLHLSLVPDGSESSYNKGTQVKANAFFEYNGNSYVSDVFYRNNPAYLEIAEDNSRIQLTPGNEGYSAEFTLSEGGTYTVRAVSESDAFRNGRKTSDAYTFTVVGEELTPGDPFNDIKLRVNEETTIELDRHFINRDMDQIAYEAAFDKTSGIVCSFDENFMKVRAGEMAGSYKITVSAKDPDMSRPLSQSFTVEVTNSAPVAVKAFDNIDLVYNTPKWISGLFNVRAGRNAEINLDDYFQDPDGQRLYYTVSELESPAAVRSSGDTSHIVSIEGNVRGKAVIHVIASDRNEEIHGEIQVAVKGWRGYWAGAAVIVLAVLFWLLLFRRRGIYGTWDITIDGNPQRDVVLLQKGGGRNRHYPLAEMVKELTDRDIGNTPILLCAGNNLNKRVAIMNLKQDNHVRLDENEEIKVKRRYWIRQGVSVSFTANGTEITLKRVER